MDVMDTNVFLLKDIGLVFLVFLEILPFIFWGLSDNKDNLPVFPIERISLNFSGDLIVIKGSLCNPSLSSIYNVIENLSFLLKKGMETSKTLSFIEE